MKLHKSPLAVVVAASLSLTFAGPANAQNPVRELASTTQQFSASPSNNTNADLEEKIKDAQESLGSSGYEFVDTFNGYDLYAVTDGNGNASLRAVAEGVNPESEVSTFGACTIAVTAGVYALGAGLLAIAAASGGLTIAGMFLAPNILNLLAGVAGSFVGIQSIIAAYVC